MKNMKTKTINYSTNSGTPKMEVSLEVKTFFVELAGQLTKDGFHPEFMDCDDQLDVCGAAWIYFDDEYPKAIALSFELTANPMHAADIAMSLQRFTLEKGWKINKYQPHFVICDEDGDFVDIVYGDEAVEHYEEVFGRTVDYR